MLWNQVVRSSCGVARGLHVIGVREANMTQSEQARADAFADAETLRLEWDRRALGVAHWADARPGYTVDGGPPDTAAHRAFLAVPGLRGEDTSGKRPPNANRDYWPEPSDSVWGEH